jgi:hypothetical protein
MESQIVTCSDVIYLGLSSHIPSIRIVVYHQPTYDVAVFPKF